jgi:glycerol-3-phosphate dehydrogenase (NAD(P)+)
MANIVILGAGVMGTAFSIPLSDKGHTVRLVGTHLDTDIIEEIHQTRIHPKLLTKVPENVVPYPISGLNDAMVNADLIVLGVNSLGIQWAVDILNPIIPSNIPLLMLTKGLFGDQHRLRLLPDVLKEGFPENINLSVSAVGGPSIAGELAARRHTCVVICGENQAFLNKLCEMLRTPYYHIWTSTDVTGVEACVALKNAYALGVGLVLGLHEKSGQNTDGMAMHNLAAAIFAQGLCETAYLVDYLGGDRNSVYSLPGAGDLYVTCQGGRNSRMGRFLGLGLKYQNAKARYMAEETVEGADLLIEIGPTLDALLEKGELDHNRLPLLRSLSQIIRKDAEILIPWDEFFYSANGSTLSFIDNISKGLE